jgi:hypothetical protein
MHQTFRPLIPGYYVEGAISGCPLCNSLPSDRIPGVFVQEMTMKILLINNVDIDFDNDGINKLHRINQIIETNIF